MTPAIESPRGQILPASQAARRIGIGIEALRAVIRAGQIATMRHENGRLRGIYERDCDAWVEKNRRAAAAVAHEPARHVRYDVDRAVDALVPADERVFG